MRLMLIEFFPGALRRNERSMVFPFLKGLAAEKGFKTLWLCYGGDVGPLGEASEGRTPGAAMPPEDLQSLSRRLRRFGPTHVVTSHALCPEAEKIFESLRPPPKRFVMARPAGYPLELALPGPDDSSPTKGNPAHCGWFLEWLGVEDPEAAGQFLVERAVPDYSTVLANRAARTAKPQITIAGGVLCANRRTVADNPHFAGVDLSGLRHRGCSFCQTALHPSLTSPGADIIAVIEAQFRGILKAGRTAGRNKHRYEFYDIHAFWKFDSVFELILRMKVPPAIFLFNPRIDDVLRLRGRIERMLPALAEAGHEIRMLSMGAENFSERENARFNKGISLAQVDEFLALTKSWELAFPGVFRPFKAGSAAAEIGFILFTPWTTLEDLHINLTLAKARNFPIRGYWLYSILLLKPTTPIYHLAKKDGGILAGVFPDRGQVYGAFKNEGEMFDVVPWRFLDPKTAEYFALLVRICAADRDGEGCPFFRGDPDFILAAGLFKQAKERADAAPLDAALGLLEAMQAPGPPQGREELLRGAMTRASAHAEARPRPPLSPEGRAIERVFCLLRKARTKTFAGVEFRPVKDFEDPEARFIRLAMSVDGREMLVDLLPLESKTPCYIKSRRFRVVRPGGGPATGARERRLWTAALRLIDAAVDGIFRPRSVRVAAPGAP